MLVCNEGIKLELSDGEVLGITLGAEDIIKLGLLIGLVMAIFRVPCLKNNWDQNLDLSLAPLLEL